MYIYNFTYNLQNKFEVMSDDLGEKDLSWSNRHFTERCRMSWRKKVAM